MAYVEPQSSSRARLAGLVDAFYELKFNPLHETIECFCKRVRENRNLIKKAGLKIPDVLVCFQLIRRLPAEYDNLVQILYRLEDKNFTLTYIETQLINESKRLDRENKDEGVKVTADVNISKHLREKKPTSNGSVSGSEEIFRQLVKCRYCKKFGHSIRKCYIYNKFRQRCLKGEKTHEAENQSLPNFSQNKMEQSLEPKKLRKADVTILNEILKVKAKLNEDLVKENNAILREFIDTFTAEMKRQDPTFALLFQRVYYTGSYYSDLRVSKPDEYDLNLLLKLPFKSTAKVEYQPQVPSYVKYRVDDQSSITREKGLAKLFENGFLIPNNVRIWIQSVVDKALKSYKPPNQVVKVRCGAAGPARTITLVKRNGTIDIDLVPAIESSLDLKPPGINGKVYEKVKNELQFFLVPKPYQPTKQCPVSEAERFRLWRVHYPEAESSLIHDMGCIKPVIKLLKLLRDKENWSILASYYLKTVALWMVIEEPNKEKWKMDSIGKKFMEALEQLKNYVENRKIPYFFSSKYNLLEKLSEAQAFNIQNRLRIIIRDIERDPQNLWSIFNCYPTFTMVS